jgi:iron complex transport system ATP-binding protein
MTNARGIQLTGLRFSYSEDAWALAIAELRLGCEPVTCIVGPNGSGKSTLLRLAAGILSPAEGSVSVGGRPLAKLPRRVIARHVGFLPQESPPLFDYTVEMTVQMGRYAHVGWLGALDSADRQAVDQALTAVDMARYRDRPLSHLSGGERRRALIAAVLAQQANFLLLDEPTASLDIHHAAAVMRMLAECAASGRAVVIVTHDINLAALFADRLLMLVNGRILADGAPSEVVCADVIHQAYGEDVLVREHPETGGPMVVARKLVDG